jgi:hypothetical protein
MKMLRAGNTLVTINMLVSRDFFAQTTDTLATAIDLPGQKRWVGYLPPFGDVFCHGPGGQDRGARILSTIPQGENTFTRNVVVTEGSDD